MAYGLAEPHGLPGIVLHDFDAIGGLETGGCWRGEDEEGEGG